MPAKDQDLASRITESVLVTAVSRLAMIATPFLVSALMWFAVDYIDQRFTTAAERIGRLEVGVAALDDLQNRVIVLETQIVRGRAEREKFEQRVIEEMAALRSGISALAVQVSGLDATLRTMRDRADLNTLPRELTGR